MTSTAEPDCWFRRSGEAPGITMGICCPVDGEALPLRPTLPNSLWTYPSYGSYSSEDVLSSLNGEIRFECLESHASLLYPSLMSFLFAKSARTLESVAELLGKKCVPRSLSPMAKSMDPEFALGRLDCVIMMYSGFSVFLSSLWATWMSEVSSANFVHVAMEWSWVDQKCNKGKIPYPLAVNRAYLSVWKVQKCGLETAPDGNSPNCDRGYRCIHSDLNSTPLPVIEWMLYSSW